MKSSVTSGINTPVHYNNSNKETFAPNILFYNLPMLICFHIGLSVPEKKKEGLLNYMAHHGIKKVFQKVMSSLPFIRGTKHISTSTQRDILSGTELDGARSDGISTANSTSRCSSSL